MTETQTYLCKNCNITSTVEVKYDRNLEDEEINKIRELKKKVKEHNENIKTKLFGLIKSDKEWKVTIDRYGFVGIKCKESQAVNNEFITFPDLFVDSNSMFLVSIGYNYVECPVCKARHYFRKPGEKKKERLE